VSTRTIPDQNEITTMPRAARRLVALTPVALSLVALNLLAPALAARAQTQDQAPASQEVPPASALRSFFSGNPQTSTRAPIGGPALLLMGGGPEVDAAFTQQALVVANGGDVVVLRISGGAGYQAYLLDELMRALPAERRAALQPNSVTTLIVDSRAHADNEAVAARVARANLVWIAGGNQALYIAAWQDTRLARAVRAAYARGAVIGGTSAGMVVIGGWMYDNGVHEGVTSAQAVADPYRADVRLQPGIFGLPLADGLLADTHFANRDRMGRLLAFMARVRQDGQARRVIGVALDEGTSLFIDRDGAGHFGRQRGSGSGYVVQEDALTGRTRVQPGQPLLYRQLQRSRLHLPGQTFDFARGVAGPGVLTRALSVEGAPPPAADAYE